MKHRPFEDWIFSEEPLDVQEANDLQMHLESCAECEKLNTAWAEVSAEIRRAPMIAPTAGFTARWQDRQAEDRYRRHLRQSLGMLAVSGGVIIILVALLTWLAAPVVGSPWVLLWVGLTRALALWANFNLARDVLATIVDVTRSLIPPYGWALLVGGATLLVGLWAFLLRLVFITRRVKI